MSRVFKPAQPTEWAAFNLLNWSLDSVNLNLERPRAYCIFDTVIVDWKWIGGEPRHPRERHKGWYQGSERDRQPYGEDGGIYECKIGRKFPVPSLVCKGMTQAGEACPSIRRRV